ncbi:MAG: MobF family relaxase [Trichloromonadaceae bacterium]
MLSISRMTGATAGNYYANLANEDYYLEGGEPPGQWWGAGTTALGLRGQVSREQLQAVLGGVDPGTGAPGSPLVQGGGTERHHPGHDLCFSAPKSVSVAWSQADEPTRRAIQSAQARAVEAALAYIQTLPTVRRGKGGAEHEAPAGLVVASYEHGTSREQDPQLHTHCLLANLAPRQDGTWGTLDSRPILQAKMAAGAIYRAQLAAEMQALGYQVEPDSRDAFRVVGVDLEIERDFSRRRQQIEEALEARGLDSALAAEVAAKDTRRQKEVRPRAELLAEWQVRAGALGWQDPRGTEPPEPQPPATREEILAGLTQQASTFSHTDLIRAVAVAAQGHRDAQGIQEEVLEILASPELVRLQAADGSDRYTTREMLQIERDLVAQAQARQAEDLHPVPPEARASAEASRTLSPEQSAALAHILGSGGVNCIQGMAGTGKSYMLGAAKEAWELAGFRVHGAALAGKAAAGLQEGAGIPSQTLHSLLADLEEGKVKLTARDVLIIDEAGMVGSRQLARLLSQAHQAGSKVVLVGDSRQLQPVDAGGAFRALTRALGAAQLSDIKRQKDDWARQAVHDFAGGQAAEALQAYQERGLLTISEDRQAAMGAMVQDWRAAWDPTRPGETLMLASTRAEVAQINQQARELLATEGLLGPGSRIEVGEGRTLEVREGDRLLCLRNSKKLGLSNGTLATVQTVIPTQGGARLTLRLDDGRQIQVSSEKYSHFSHGYAVTTHKAQGVTVDRAYILGGGSMSSRELAYVQMSRHRVEARLYLDQAEADQEANLAAAARAMSRERQKETTLDFAPVPAPAAEQQEPPQIQPAPPTAPEPEEIRLARELAAWRPHPLAGQGPQAIEEEARRRILGPDRGGVALQFATAQAKADRLRDQLQALKQQIEKHPAHQPGLLRRLLLTSEQRHEFARLEDRAAELQAQGREAAEIARQAARAAEREESREWRSAERIEAEKLKIIEEIRENERKRQELQARLTPAQDQDDEDDQQAGPRRRLRR